MRMYSETDRSGSSIRLITKNLTEFIDIDVLNICYHFSHRESEIAQIHIKELRSFMVETCISLKSQNICREVTFEEKGDISRREKNRETISRGR